jgi:aspartyl-tRNA(Asn)/glutamyl-tRNA(Gln) amidotransferase subunit B
VSMRSKEFAHDYRYFPEPDLPPLHVDARWQAEVQAGSPKLPEHYRDILTTQYGLTGSEAKLATPSGAMAEYVLHVVSGAPDPRVSFNWIVNEVFRVVPPEDDKAVERFAVPAENLKGLVGLIHDGTISGKIAKDVFETMVQTGQDAASIVRTQGLTQVADAGELGSVVDRVLVDHPKVVDDWKGGKKAAMGFLVGQVMKATQGRANPALVNTLLGEKLRKA